MAGQTGHYLCSEETLIKADRYLKALIAKTEQPGNNLHQVLTEAGANLEAMNAKELIAFMMNTRKPKIFAESEPLLDGSDWNLQENAILGDILLSTTGTHAFNNGAHVAFQQHSSSFEVNFLFVSSALLRNDKGHQTADMEEVLVDGVLNEEAFYRLYERRLLPGLLAQNAQAKRENTSLVINIPGLGCGQFAGVYGAEVRAALPRVLKRLFETHAAKLDMIHTVNYDPYLSLSTDEFTTDKIPNSQIRLMARPLQGLPAGARGSAASQLEFPKDGTDYSKCRLVKVVAWDHFSFPGNDIWVNLVAEGNGRATDDGVSFASSDVVLSLFNMGQFGADSRVEEISYNPAQGIVYAVNPENGKILGYKELAELYPFNVTADMITVVRTLSLTPLIVSEFEKNKKILQKQFLMKLDDLETQFKSCVAKKTVSQTDGDQLILALRQNQNHFFELLTPQLSADEISSQIANFRKTCKRNIELADKIMGQGWLFRTVEVLIKAVVGLFAGIGMMLGTLVGQGIANTDHRHRFASTFFTLAQTKALQALHQYGDKISTELDSLSPINLGRYECN